MTRTEAQTKLSRAGKAMAVAMGAYQGIYDEGVPYLDTPEGQAALGAWNAFAAVHADEMTKATRSLTAQSV